MKRNTHIYIACKAIDLLWESVSNIYTTRGYLVHGKSKKLKLRNKVGDLRDMLHYYRDLTEEASWVPDDVIHDNDPNHIFKLFTDDEFAGHGLKEKFSKTVDGVDYYKFGGALPYRVDHLARSINAMNMLRLHRDQFSLRQVAYHYLMISHYVADAHVPMHCDLRDDPPNQGNDTNPSRRRGSNKPAGLYLHSGMHEKIEGKWDKAVNPVAFEEGYLTRIRIKELKTDNTLSPQIVFGPEDCKAGGIIKTHQISKNGLMDFMIDVCINTKKRSQQLFLISDPSDYQAAIFPGLTRDIFADCLGNLMSVWLYTWELCES